MRPNLYELLKDSIKVCDTVLDVGCLGEEAPLRDLVDFEQSFNKLIGIDKGFEDNAGNMYGVYLEARRKKGFQHDDEVLETLTVFIDKYDIQKEDMFDFFDANQAKYSLIICNKVLHLFPDEIKIYLITEFINSLQKDGLLYLKINHNRHWEITKPEYTIKVNEEIYVTNKEHEAKGQPKIWYLIDEEYFKSEMRKKHRIIEKYTSTNEKHLTMVIQKSE